MFGFAAVGIALPIPEVAALFPWAKSVVSAALSYSPPVAGPRPNECGYVARFARSTDYHLVLRRKLDDVAKYLAMEFAADFEVCVDTTPIPERRLAAASGIGWLGRNCNLFVNGCGSYVVLGEVITDIPVPASTFPLTCRCDNCRLCVDACPTGALRGDGTLDRTLCLSYVTQASGVVPETLWSPLGLRIYGCDTCQSCCPHNKGLLPGALEFATAAFPGAYPSISWLLSLSRREYKTIAAGSSIAWLGRTRVFRNAIIAAVNQGMVSIVPLLTSLHKDPSATLRETADHALSLLHL